MKQYFCLLLLLLILLCGCTRTVVGSEKCFEGIVADLAMDRGRSYIGVSFGDGGDCFYAAKGKRIPGDVNIGDTVRVETVLEEQSGLRIVTAVTVLTPGTQQ